MRIQGGCERRHVLLRGLGVGVEKIEERERFVAALAELTQARRLTN